MTYYNNFIQHGDKVSCIINGKEVTNARISVDDGGRMYICNDVYGSYQLDRDNYSKAFYVGYQDSPQLMGSGVTNFRIHERADGTPVYMQGDVIENKYGKTRKVLAVHSDGCLPSLYDEHEKVCRWFTLKELHELDYKLRTPEEEKEKVKEMTVEEVSNELGYEVKIIKNK